MLFLLIITYCYLVATAFLNLKPKSILEMVLGVELKAKTNDCSFDDPRGMYGSNENVSFGSPISMSDLLRRRLRSLILNGADRFLVSWMSWTLKRSCGS